MKVNLRGGWPIHLAGHKIIYGIIDDCIASESFTFHSPDEEDLLIFLDERYNSDDLYWYDMIPLGRYVDIHLTIRHIGEKEDIILDEIHLTCYRNDL